MAQWPHREEAVATKMKIKRCNSLIKNLNNTTTANHKVYKAYPNKYFYLQLLRSRCIWLLFCFLSCMQQVNNLFQQEKGCTHKCLRQSR